MQQIDEFQFYGGSPVQGRQIFLFEFPRPPEDGGSDDQLEALLAGLASGQKPNIDSMPVLGPYYSAVIFNTATNQRDYFILGQTAMGESDTTLRSVWPDGTNANCGPGPSSPTASGFMKILENR